MGSVILHPCWHVSVQNDSIVRMEVKINHQSSVAIGIIGLLLGQVQVAFNLYFCTKW